ncbi:MAG: SagB/ThcOx family dehydrogenase, partial [Alphaproteobacteria bacterium]|nr:SagB/ThcOx family dehydrogenase [Alphaproteobacteria bacterium]
MTQTAFAKSDDPRREIVLQKPDRDGRVTLEAVLAKRRSVRDFSRAPVTLRELSQLLWAGQGITGRAEFRTAPSAGALYPLDLYVAAGQVKDLPAGVFRYHPAKHALEQVAAGDRREQLSQAALSQSWIGDSAAVLAITATPRRTTWKYGERGLRYIHMEAGHVAQNICLQTVSLGLA